MDRGNLLKVLIVSIRRNVAEITLALEELNSGAREQTFPKSLERHFRAIEHDARAVGLVRLGDVVAKGKLLSRDVLDHETGPRAVELLTELAGELERVAEDLAADRRHRLDAGLVKRVEAAARKAAAPPGPLGDV